MAELCDQCSKIFKSTQALQHHKHAKHTSTQGGMSKGMSKKHMTYAIVAVIILGLVYAAYYLATAPAKYDALAQCLTKNGATFYGAFWCPHCKEQKDMLGSSMQYIKYVECSTPDGRGQTDICKEKNIQSYPTWIFADGTESGGVQQPKALAARANCEATV